MLLVLVQQKKFSPEKLRGKFLIGEFKNTTEPEYTEEYQKIIDKFVSK